MRARPLGIAIALCIAPATASGAGGPKQAISVCTWGGTPAAPSGVITFEPGVTHTPSTGPVAFTATGPLAGGTGCAGRLTFHGVLERGTTCAVSTPFHARAVGLPGVKRAEAGPGVVGSAPVLLYDAHGNVVGSEQAQFLTDALNLNESAFMDCGTPQGVRRAVWSDTIEFFDRPARWP